ncbi:hypothetical protein ACHAXA_010876 [Cyclostephanos tholiformis]|uniref:Uncharacterized protein n=1 Tax=Cyclostephanos tholiformis TaxID=382380 RepID=A0ABD3SCZ8_9STRA
MALHRCSITRVTDDQNIQFDEDTSDDDAEDVVADVVLIVEAASLESSVDLSYACVESGDRMVRESSPPSSKGPRLVQGVVIVSLIGVLALSSLSIGYAIAKHQIESLYPKEGDVVEIVHGGESREQDLLEIAERVIVACGEEMLDVDMSRCQDICRSRMCCFESGKNACEEKEGGDCAVYAGCEALVAGDASP